MTQAKKQLIYRGYVLQKRIRSLVTDADNQSKKAKILRATITLADLEAMDRYISLCEDIGLHHLREVN